MYLRTIVTAIARIHLGLNTADRYGQLWQTFQECTTRTTTGTQLFSEDNGLAVTLGGDTIDKHKRNLVSENVKRS